MKNAGYYQLFFTGKIVDGFTDTEVKEKLTSIFKGDAKKVEMLFTGRPVLVKKRAAHHTPQNYVNAFKKAGIIGMGLQVFMGDPEDLMKGLEDRDKVKAVKVVGVQKKPAAVKATKKKKAAAAPMIAVSAQNRSKAAEWSAKAQALWKNGKYTEPQNAIRYLDLAVGLNPNDAVHYNNRGLTKRDLGQYEKAIEDYNRAIELDPKYALAYNNRGVANYELAEYEKAIKDYSQAIRIDPKYVDAYFNQALANYQLDEIDRMCNFFEKACELGACEGFEWAKQESLCK